MESNPTNASTIETVEGLAVKDYVKTMRFQSGFESIVSLKGDTKDVEKITNRFIVNLVRTNTSDEVREIMSNLMEDSGLDKFKVNFDWIMPYYSATEGDVKVDVYLSLPTDDEKEREILSELAGCELTKNEYKYSSGGYSCKIKES